MNIKLLIKFRERKKYSQQQMAEKLGYNDRNLNTQYLAYHHLKTKFKVSDYIFPDLEIHDLSVSILSLHKEIKDFIIY